MEKERIEYIASDWEEKEEWGIALRDKTAQPVCNPTNGYLQHFDNRKEETGDSGDLGNQDSIAAHRLYRWLRGPENVKTIR